MAGARVLVSLPPDPVYGREQAQSGVHARTDTNGEFVIRSLPAERSYDLVVSYQGEQTIVRGVAPNSPPVHITLRSVANVKIGLDGFGDAPVRVRVFSEQRVVFDVTTSATSSPTIPGVSRGVAWIVAVAGPRVAAERLIVEPPVEGSVTLRPRPLVAVKGKVLNGDPPSTRDVVCAWAVVVGDAEATIAPVPLARVQTFAFEAPMDLALSVRCRAETQNGLKVGVATISALGPGGVDDVVVELGSNVQ